MASAGVHFSGHNQWCRLHVKILVTGGAGFFGSAVVRHILGDTGDWVISFDKLTYAGNIDGHNEKQNIKVVHTVCALLDEPRPDPAFTSQFSLITYVSDRPGYDVRYAIDARKIHCELAWPPEESFDSGLRKTIEWYLNDPDWLAYVKSGAYQQWLDTNYLTRTETA